VWIPKWLGEIYSRLHFRLEAELFTFTEAKKALDIEAGKLNVAFSKLHSERILTVFRRSRPRAYRLLDPSEFVLLASGAVENVEKMKQERYLPLILKGYRRASRLVNIGSFAVYGSVARGRAREDSDVDVLIRLLDPSEFVLLASGAVENVDKMKQERYLPLILKGYRQASRFVNIGSFAVYGSVARGRAREDSDVDVLMISDDFHGSLGSRIERLMGVEDAVQHEVKWLRENGIRTGLSFYPLNSREAEGLPYLFLDLTEDAIILHDKGRRLEGLFKELGAKLIERGAVRVFLDEDRWYWDLKPDYRFGEVVEIA